MHDKGSLCTLVALIGRGGGDDGRLNYFIKCKYLPLKKGLKERAAEG